MQAIGVPGLSAAARSSSKLPSAATLKSRMFLVDGSLKQPSHRWVPQESSLVAAGYTKGSKWVEMGQIGESFISGTGCATETHVAAR